MEFPDKFIQALLPRIFLIPFSLIKYNKPDRFGLGYNAFSQPYCACYGVTMLNQKYWFKSTR